MEQSCTEFEFWLRECQLNNKMHRLWHIIEDYDEEFSKPIANPATSDIMTYKELYLNNELLTVLGAHNLNRSCIEFSGQSINSSIKHIYFFYMSLITFTMFIQPSTLRAL